MPCGTGKTYISYLLANKFSYILLLSSLQQYAEYNLRKYTEFGWNGTSFLLSSSDNSCIKTLKKHKSKDCKILSTGGEKTEKRSY